MRVIIWIVLAGLFCNSLFGVSQKDSLVVGYTIAPPFIYENPNGEPDGLNYRIWEELMKREGLASRYVLLSFEQTLKSLQNGEIDVSIAPLSLTAAREEQFQFTTPYFASHGSVAVASYSSWHKFRDSLSGLLNSNFLKAFSILIAIIFLFGVLGWYFEWKQNTEHFRKGVAGIWDGVWWSAVTLTTVGYGDKAPKTIMGKIAALLLMFGGLIFVSGLTAGIASSIAANEQSNNFSSLNNFKTLRVGTVADTQIHDYLKTHFFKDVQAYTSPEDGLNALAKGELKGFMFDEEILRSEIELLSLSDQLQVLPIKYDSKFYGFGISQGNDSLRLGLSKGILEIRDDTDWQMILHEYGLSDFN